MSSQYPCPKCGDTTCGDGSVEAMKAIRDRARELDAPSALLALLDRWVAQHEEPKRWREMWAFLRGQLNHDMARDSLVTRSVVVDLMDRIEREWPELPPE